MGSLDEAAFRSIMKLHAVPSDVEQRVLVIARTYASNLLDHIARSLKQAETGKPLTGPVGRA